MPCPLRTLLRAAERLSAIAVLVAAGRFEPDDDDLLASPIGMAESGWRTPPPRSLPRGIAV